MFHKIYPIILILFFFNPITPNNIRYVESFQKDTISKIIEIKDINAGTLVKKIEGTNKYELIPRIENNINVQINGMIANTQMEQLFINDSSEPIEVTYIFPLNHNAAVNDMYFIVNDRIIESKIKEKSQAKKEYIEAKKNGKRAAIVNQQRPNIFEQSMANIMPNDSIKVIINYVQNLQYENQAFTYRLPLSITPRYYKNSLNLNSTDPISSIISSDDKINPLYLDDSMDFSNDVSINLDLNLGFEIKEIESSHKITIKNHSKSHSTINLKNGKIQTDQDFILKYTIPSASEPQISVFQTKKFDDDYYMIMAMGPNDINLNQQISKEITFIIDKSGSMNGHNIEYAKISVIEALNNLKNNDSFNIISFNDNFDTFNYKPVQANQKNIELATKFIYDIESRGGTEALPALEWAMQEEHDNNKIKMIIFLTDGAVGYENDVFQLIDLYNVNNARIFPICIGYAPNSFLLEKVAEMTRGSYTYIKNHGEITKQLNLLFNKIENPVLSNIEINFDKNNEFYPNPIKDLYLNEPLMIFCKSDSPLNEINFKGETSNGDFVKTFNLNNIKVKKNPAIPFLWARKKISSLMNYYRLSSDKNEKDTLKGKIIKISQDYNIISKFTSFIAIESEIVNKRDYLLSTNIAAKHPKNWKKRKSNKPEIFNQNHINMPQTSTKNPLLLLLGLILMITAYFMRRFNAKIN